MLFLKERSGSSVVLQPQNVDKLHLKRSELKAGTCTDLDDGPQAYLIVIGGMTLMMQVVAELVTEALFSYSLRSRLHP